VSVYSIGFSIQSSTFIAYSLLKEKEKQFFCRMCKSVLLIIRYLGGSSNYQLWELWKEGGIKVLSVLCLPDYGIFRYAKYLLYVPASISYSLPPCYVVLR
jgi:hypothetical protein